MSRTPDPNVQRNMSVGSSGDAAASAPQEALARMRQYNHELDLLMQLHFASATPLPEFLKAATETASRMLRIKRASVWTYSEDRQKICCADLYDAEAGVHSDGDELQSEEFSAYFEAVYASRVIDVHDAQSDPRTQEFTASYLRPLNIVSMMGAQIPSSVGVRGVLSCSSVGVYRRWTPDEASFAASLAERVGLAIERDEQVTIQTAIEQRNHQMEDQSAELARLALVAQHTEDVVVICDKGRRIEWVNPAFTKLTGYSVSEARGRSPGIMLQGEQTDSDTTQKISHALAQKKPIRTQIRNYSKSGSAYWLELQINPVFDEKGDIERYIAVERDITQRMEREEKLAAALNKAEQANAAKSTFLATMSHEIRTPMNGVLGMAAALSATDLSEKQSRLLGVIRDSGDMLLRILNDVLDFSRIEAGKITIEKVPFQLSDVLQKIESLHALKARERGIELAVRGDEGLNKLRLGDPTRIWQVLHNLVGNAIKFTDHGEVTVFCTVFDDESDQSEVMFEVKDTGIGMTPDQLSRVFDRFQQADDSTTRRYGGTGLGLSIAKGLTNAMGGRISVESAENTGSVFRVWLPTKVTHAAEAENDEMDAPEADGSAPYADIAILAAEDNAINRMVLQTFMEPLGFKLTFAENGKEAVDLCEKGNFDIVLMDIQMPVMDGEQALAEIRRLEELSDRDPVPVIAVTACTLDHEVAHYEEVGFNGFVSKPVNAESICAAVCNCLIFSMKKSA